MSSATLPVDSAGMTASPLGVEGCRGRHLRFPAADRWRARPRRGLAPAQGQRRRLVGGQRGCAPASDQWPQRGRHGHQGRGPVELIGPDDPYEGVDAERLRLLRREVFTAAGGTHEDFATYDRVMVAERRTVVLVHPEKVYSNPTR